MNRYVIGSSATGEILRSVVCDQDQVESQVGTGETLDLSDDAEPATHYFVEGAVVAYTPEQAAKKSARPAYTSGWSNESMTWGVDGDLAMQRTAKWDALKTERERRIVAPKQTSVGVFDADPQSTANLANVIALTAIAVSRGLPGTARYTLADNTRQTLTLEQLQTAALEMGAQVQALYDQGDELRSATDAASTAAELAAVDWPAT